MSRATIISIAPCVIIQSNPSIVPPDIMIAACADEDMPVFHIIDDVNTIEYVPLKAKGKGGRLNKIDGLDYAKSLVNDFLNSIIYSDIGSGATPGVIALEGKVSVIASGLLDDLKAKQSRWKDVVISKTDDVWNKFGQRKFIMDLAVTISNNMNLDKEWAKKASDVSKKICPACMTPVHPMASICANCKTIIDPERYAKFQSAMS